MTAIQFSVPGVPIAKGRPRFSRRGAFTVAYTPEKTVRYESTVTLFGKQAMGGRELIDGPVMCELCAVFPIPASWPKKRQQAASEGSVRPTGRPDIENVSKAVLDALNGVCWRDDSQVVQLNVRKQYGLEPLLHVWIRPL